MAKAPSIRSEAVKAVDLANKPLETAILVLHRIELNYHHWKHKSGKWVKGGVIQIHRVRPDVELEQDGILSPGPDGQPRNSVPGSTYTVANEPEHQDYFMNLSVEQICEKLLKYFDKANSNAEIHIKGLKAHATLPRERIISERRRPKVLFQVLFDLDALMVQGYRYDPQTGAIRRTVEEAFKKYDEAAARTDWVPE